MPQILEHELTPRMWRLLKASRDFLKELKKRPDAIEVMSTTVLYDQTMCDGYCLLDDIISELNLEEDDG